MVTEPPPAPVTARVVRRVLTDEFVTRGTVEISEVVSIAAPEVDSPRAVVTSIEVVEGTSIGEGAVIGTVSGRPVVLLEGSFPAFRELSRGDRGVDVVQLQSALARLGYYEGEIDGRFGRATEKGVERLYRERGFRLPEGSAVEAPGANGEGGGDPGSGGGGVRVPLGELVFVPELPSRVVAVRATVGDVLTAGATLVDLSTGAVRVAASVPASRATSIEVGEEAKLLDEADGAMLRAQVTEIAQEPSAESGLLEYAVELAPSESAEHLIGRNVRVTFDLATTDEPVLAVPITAVWSRSEGTFVTVVDSGGEREVRVDAGQVIGGWVEIVDVAGSLGEGDMVVVSR